MLAVCNIHFTDWTSSVLAACLVVKWSSWRLIASFKNLVFIRDSLIVGFRILFQTLVDATFSLVAQTGRLQGSPEKWGATECRPVGKWFPFLSKTVDGFDETRDLIGRKRRVRIHWVFQKTLSSSPIRSHRFDLTFVLADGMERGCGLTK